MAPVPKKKHTRSRSSQRRNTYKLAIPSLVKCKNCGKFKLPHRACAACGKY